MRLLSRNNNGLPPDKTVPWFGSLDEAGGVGAAPPRLISVPFSAFLRVQWKNRRDNGHFVRFPGVGDVCVPSKRGLSRSRAAARWRFFADEKYYLFLDRPRAYPANDYFFSRQNQKRLTEYDTIIKKNMIQ